MKLDKSQAIFVINDYVTFRGGSELTEKQIASFGISEDTTFERCDEICLSILGEKKFNSKQRKGKV